MKLNSYNWIIHYKNKNLYLHYYFKILRSSFKDLYKELLSHIINIEIHLKKELLYLIYKSFKCQKNLYYYDSLKIKKNYSSDWNSKLFESIKYSRYLFVLIKIIKNQNHFIDIQVYLKIKKNYQSQNYLMIVIKDIIFKIVLYITFKMI